MASPPATRRHPSATPRTGCYGTRRKTAHPDHHPQQATGGAGPGKSGNKRSRRRRGAKRDREAVTAEVVVQAAEPPGARFKGYQDILVRELTLTPAVVRYRRERWATPSGETVLAPLPAGIVGGFGP